MTLVKTLSRFVSRSLFPVADVLNARADKNLRAYGLKLDDVTAQDYRFPLFEEAMRRYHKHPERMLRSAVASDLWLKKATLPEELQAPKGSAIAEDEMTDLFVAVKQEHHDERFYKK